MYSTVHKLVAAARYAGVMRIGLVADKMQKWVPKEKEKTPNFGRYRRLYQILLRECRNAVQAYNRYKNPAAANAQEEQKQ